MSKVQVEIEIPDNKELLYVEQHAGTNEHVFFTAVLIDKWQWPAWLKCDWIGRNSNGRLAIGRGRHCLGISSHCSEDSTVDYVDADSIDTKLPLCTDWIQSLRLNPNRRSTS